MLTTFQVVTVLDDSVLEEMLSWRNVELALKMLIQFNDFLRFYFFNFRERGRERKREGEKHQCVVAFLAPPPTGDLACNPGMCPDWELNQWLLGLETSTQSTEPHQPGLMQFQFLKNYLEYFFYEAHTWFLELT